MSKVAWGVSSYFSSAYPKSIESRGQSVSSECVGLSSVLGNFSSETLANDWRVEIADFLKNPSQKVTKKLRYKLTKYVLLNDQLYYKTVDGVLLKYLSQEEARVLIGEVHEGICGAHQSAYKTKWVIHRSRYFWPTILEEYFEYYKGCQDCQRFGNVQKLPASAMNPIIKPWPFRGWELIWLARFFYLQVEGTSLYW